jgi:formate hydrogenlyase subunit 4
VSLLVAITAQAAHLGLVLAATVLFPCWLALLRARFAGRRAPPILQPWRDLVAMTRKVPVVAEGTSMLVRAAPAAALAATGLAVAVAPSFVLGMVSAPGADLAVIGGLLALSRVILALASMDAATPFGAISGSRALTSLALALPAFVVAFAPVTLLTGTTNIDAIARAGRDGLLAPRASLLLGLVATILAATAVATETDEAALDLEYSGRYLAMLRLARSLGAIVAVDLTLSAFAPFGMADTVEGSADWTVAAMVWVAKLAVVGGLAAVWRAVSAVPPIARRAGVLAFATLAGALAAVLVIATAGTA